MKITISKFPGESKTLRVGNGTKVAEAAQLAGFSLENNEIRVNEEPATAQTVLHDDDDILITKAMVSQKA